MEQKNYALREVLIRLERGRTLYSGEEITNAEDAVRVMQEELRWYDREAVCIVNVNTKKQPINFNIVSIGTLDTSLVNMANVLKSSILSNAGAFIMLHNHPSGDLSPSREDLEVTKKMILAGSLIGIPCLDHIIIAGGRKEIYSMRTHRDLTFAPDDEQVQGGVSAIVAENEVLYHTPFGDESEAVLKKAVQGGQEKETKEEITIKFGKGLCQFFTSKKGDELARIKIPDTPYESWPSFVVGSQNVHENRYGKGYYIKLPADGKTTLTISRRTDDKEGVPGWERKEIQVDNRYLKELVEAYKKEPPDKEIKEDKTQEKKPGKKGR